MVFGPSLQSGRRAAVAALECRPGDRVLEICVGTGLSLPMYPGDVRVVGVDISTAMLAKAAVRTQGLAQVQGLLQMDAQRLSFADGSFDKVAMLYALSGVPNPVTAVREMRRVCRPGGTIVIAGHFQCEGPLLRLCERLLGPIYALLRYRSDLDFDSFQAAARLDIVCRRRANLFGYTTLLVCRNRGPVEHRQTATPRPPVFQATTRAR